MTTVYSTSHCPRCQWLKGWLYAHGISFDEADMATPAAITELRINGVHTLQAPVLEHNGKFLTELDDYILMRIFK